MMTLSILMLECSTAERDEDSSSQTRVTWGGRKTSFCSQSIHEIEKRPCPRSKVSILSKNRDTNEKIKRWKIIFHYLTSRWDIEWKDGKRSIYLWITQSTRKKKKWWIFISFLSLDDFRLSHPFHLEFKSNFVFNHQREEKLRNEN